MEQLGTDVNNEEEMMVKKRYESIEDALMYSIMSANKSYKEIAARLWPSDNIENAHRRLHEALNSSRRQKLSADEIIFICNYCNRYDAIHYMEDECLLTRSTKKVVEVEFQESRRMIGGLYEQATKLFQDMLHTANKHDEIQKLREEGEKIVNKIEEVFSQTETDSKTETEEVA